MTLRWFRSLGLLALLSFAGTAWAADDDWTLPDEDEDEDEDAGKGSGSGSGTKPPPPPADDDLDVKKTLEDTEGPDEDEFPMGDEPQPVLEFDDEDEDEDRSEAQQPGEDTATIYRAKIDEMKGWAADEEAMEWEQYLKRYPNSLFRSRIEARLD